MAYCRRANTHIVVEPNSNAKIGRQVGRTMSSRSDIQCNNISSSKVIKKRLQAKKQLSKFLEFENAGNSQSRNILELVKRNILMCHQTKTSTVQKTDIQISQDIENRLQDTQRMPLTDQRNVTNGKSNFEGFECSTVTKQLLRKAILEKQKEKMLREVQPKEKYINYKLWRPW